MRKISSLLYLLFFVININNAQILKRGKFTFLKNQYVSGHFAMNDSILFCNNVIDNNISVININSRTVVSTLNYTIKDASWWTQGDGSITSAGNVYTEWYKLNVPNCQDNDNIYFIATQNSIQYCVKIRKSDFTEIWRFKIELGGYYGTDVVNMACIGDNLYIYTMGGDFYNKNSTVAAPIPPGVVMYDLNGYLISNYKITRVGTLNGGQVEGSPKYPIMIPKTNSLIVGTSIGSGPYSSTNIIRTTSGDITPTLSNSNYYFIELDTNLNYINKMDVKGPPTGGYYDAQGDSVCVFGTDNNLSLQSGQTFTQGGAYFHYKYKFRNFSRSFSGINSYSGSQGIGPRCFFGQINNKEFYYLSFRGSMLFNQPYTSLGGENLITGLMSSQNPAVIDDSKTTYLGCLNNINIVVTQSQNRYFAAFSNPDFYSDVRYQDTGLYILTYNQNGLVDPDSLRSTPPCPTPAISYNGSNQICQGTTITLTSSSNIGNQWYLNNVAISGANSSAYIASASGVYTLVTTVNGCVSNPSNPVTITINQLPTASVTPSGTLQVCNGTSTTLTANSGTGLTYQWKLNGSNISGATSSTYLVTQAGVYNVVITNASGCNSLSNSVTIVVNSIPATPVISALGPTSFCSGSSVVLNSSSSTGNQWFKNGTIITGATGVSYQAITSGSYSVSVYDNGCSSASSSSIIVNVNPNPAPPIPTITWNGTQFSTTATGVTYQWYFNGNAISGATSSTYTPTSIGTYQLQVASNGCSNYSDNFNLVVTGIDPTLILSPYNAQVFPNPASTDFAIKFGETPETTLELQLVNNLGAVVKSVKTKSQLTTMKVSDLSSGVYYLKIIGGNYNQTKKVQIIKQK